jgi:hypothetical protein
MEQNRARSLSLASVVEILGRYHKVADFDSGTTHGNRMGLPCIQEKTMDTNATDARPAVQGPRVAQRRVRAQNGAWVEQALACVTVPPPPARQRVEGCIPWNLATI